MQATQLRLKHEEAEDEAKKQQAEARRLAVRNKDLESRSQVNPATSQMRLGDPVFCCTQHTSHGMWRLALHCGW